MAFLTLIFTMFGYCSRIIESVLFRMMDWYDIYVYSPLQVLLLPVMSYVPRYVRVYGKDYTIFSANIVSWTRTALVIPIAICLKNGFYWTAFSMVILHDFLDHLDGIVAKAQRTIYGSVDDPLLGGFMDAFCDKKFSVLIGLISSMGTFFDWKSFITAGPSYLISQIVNVFALWSIMLTTDYTEMSWNQISIFIGSCSIIIVFEGVLGVVRVQDYFRSYYLRLLRKNDTIVSKADTAAVMAGKLKEKLESMGIAFLCLAEASPVPIMSISGISGVTCLLLSVRLAYASLQQKLTARAKRMKDEIDFKEIPETTDDGEKRAYTEKKAQKLRKSISVCETNGFKHLKDGDAKLESMSNDKESAEDLVCNEIDNLSPVSPPLRGRCNSVPKNIMDTRVDKVYTVGCFDLFHTGHVTLLQRMRALGKQVIVGVHDSRSIFKLKRRVPIDSTEKRMLNVKKYADMVFCIGGTDPTSYLSSVVCDVDDALYVRGDDMPNFPARSFVESVMPVCLLPYTHGVYCVAGTDPTNYIHCMLSDNVTIERNMYVRGDDMKNFPARHLCEAKMTIKFLPYTEGVSSTKRRHSEFTSCNYGPHTQDDVHAMFY